MTAGAVVVVQTGVENLASVLAGLRRAGVEPAVVNDARSVTQARQVVLPGVGCFAAAIGRLRSGGLADALARRVREGRPTLAICLGLQLFAESSEESPGCAGLGVFVGRVARFGSNVRVPQFGWNCVSPQAQCELVRPGYAYFANSYRLIECPGGWRAAFAEHGGRFVAALERGSVLACQFHPELSGSWGVALLRRWLEADQREVTPC